MGLEKVGYLQIPANTILASITAASTNLSIVQTEMAARQFDVELMPDAELYIPTSMTDDRLETDQW